jgi:GNAT superfamily N-acetyltransferase
MRIELTAPPAVSEWPDGLELVPLDADRDARAVHAAHQETFGDLWGFAPRDFDSWSKSHLEGPRFDPGLWCVLRDGTEVAAGAICTGETYGGGWVHVLFTRRPWRHRGIGTALLQEAFRRFWDRGERNVGLAADAENDTGAFRLYERAGMAPALGWVLYEKAVTPDGASLHRARPGTPA